MKDVGKIPYLVGTGKDQKLKRNVPARFKAVAERTAWVERLPHMPPALARQRSHLFGVMTDNDMRNWEARLRASPAQGDLSELVLDETRASQIAVAYFRKRDTRNAETGAYLLSPTDRGRDELIFEAFSDMQEALEEASGERRTSGPRVVRLLAEEGVISQKYAEQLLSSEWPDSLGAHGPFQRLCRMVEQADLELTRRRYRSWTTGTIAPIEIALFQPSASRATTAKQPAVPIGHSIADLQRGYEASKLDRVTSSRMNQYQIPFRVLVERFGAEYPLSQLSRDDCRSVLAFLPTIPSYASKRYKGFPLTVAAERHLEATGVAANRFEEASKHLNVIRDAFQFAVDEGWLERNPWDGLSVDAPRNQRKKHAAKEATYQPFTIEELNKLFALPLFTGCVDDENGCHTPGPNLIRRHRYWAPILALWTGMRMGEILQLEREDIKRTPQGTPYVSVTDEVQETGATGDFAKRVKTRGSVRDIPLHPFLERIGFLEWAEQTDSGRLFPEAKSGAGEKPSDVYSKRFRTNAKRAGIYRDRRKVFHSFRNSFNDALREAGVPKEHRDAINGWSEGRSMDRRYGKGHSIERLYRSICQISYPGLVVGRFSC